MNEQLLVEWKRLYEEEELSYNEIGRRYNVASRMVNNALHKIVQARPKSKYEHLADEWLNLYLNEGYAKQHIAMKYNVSAGVVQKVLEKRGIKPETRKSQLKYAHLTNTWINQYQEGMSLQEISDACSERVNVETVRQYLIREDVRIRGYSEAIRKHHVEDHYFDEVNSKLKAYHLGLVFGIGSLIAELNSYGIRFSGRELVSKIDFLGEGSLHEDNKRPGIMHFRIQSKPLFERVSFLGLNTNKSLSVFPELSKPLITSFILGLWEGRGTSKTGGSVSFCASAAILEGLVRVFKEIVPEESLVIESRKDKSSYRLYIRKRKNYRKVMQWIYKDNLFYTPSRVPKWLEIE